MKDLVVLVADKNMQFALLGALSRPEALGIRPVTHEFRTHMGRDGGVRASGADLLARDRQRFAHSVLVLDFDGSGAREGQTVEELEAALDEQIRADWDGNGKAIVIAPELEVWIWGSDNALKESLHWPLDVSIRDRLQDRGFAFDAGGKPQRPKEALEALVRIHRQPRSSALYAKITGRISLRHCSDPAFLRLRAALRSWFPPTEDGW